ncbi:MAG: hypothetical protein HWN65_18915 [Candidatus Helarchaeota archaeon]|nr:hypothetical protein [Candidatus Helarchaeota archaeon]
MHDYEEIPDSYKSKEYLLLCPHIFRCFRELGLEYFDNIYPEYKKILPEATNYRFSNMIFTSKEIMEGKIPPEQAEKIILYTIPHVMSVRADLQMGLLKLLFGDSTDISFLILNDENNEIFHVTNLHAENGIPVDWWQVDSEDELLERRHIKYGYKLREIPSKTKNLIKASKMIRDTLMDIRNERTPWWQASMYSLSSVNTACMFNLFAELSNYEMFNLIWMGLNTKRIYGMADQLFNLYPSPPLIGTLAFLLRREWTSKLVGLASGRRLVLHQVEDVAIDWIKEKFPEALSIMLLEQWKQGIPNPRMSMACDIPEDKDKMLNESGDLVRQYPEGSRLTLENLEVPQDEGFKGYLTNITDEDPLDLSISKQNLISKNMGRFTKFF